MEKYKENVFIKESINSDEKSFKRSETNTIKLTSRSKKKLLSSQLDDQFILIKDILEYKKNMMNLILMAEQKMITPQLRKTLWIIYLDILNTNRIKYWYDDLNKIRKKYTTELFEAESNLEKNVNLMHIITIDVKRTYQEYDIFKNKSVLNILIRVLFTWVQLYFKEVGYIQGMNEIAGTILLVLFSTSQIRSNSKDDFSINSTNISRDTINNSDDIDHIAEEICFTLNNENYIEHDLFIIFSNVMNKGMKELFDYYEKPISNEFKNGLIDGFEVINNNDNSTLEKIINKHSTAIRKRTEVIFHFYLKIIDKDVYNFLCYFDVDPNIYLFRWLICLLTREFKIETLLYIWDVIFSFNKSESIFLEKDCKKMKGYKLNNFNFIDFIMVAMLINIKKVIDISKDNKGNYSSDQMNILMYLLNINNQHFDFFTLIKEAFKIKDKLFERMTEESIYEFL